VTWLRRMWRWLTSWVQTSALDGATLTGSRSANEGFLDVFLPGGRVFYVRACPDGTPRTFDVTWSRRARAWIARERGVVGEVGRDESRAALVRDLTQLALMVRRATVRVRDRRNRFVGVDRRRLKRG